MARHLASFGTAAEAAVEAVVFAVRTVPGEPYLGLLLQAGEGEYFTAACHLAARLLGRGGDPAQRPGRLGRRRMSGPTTTSKAWPRS